jgi:hypothetical protein
MSTLNIPPAGYLWTEPESAANTDYQPVYPYNNATVSESGHKFEIDDTPGRERVRLSHRTGTFIEMHPNGDEVHKVFGDGYEITIKNKNVLIQGSCTVQIEGDCNMNVLKDMNVQVGGDYNLLVQGKTNIRSHKDISISGDDDISIAANEQFGGSLRLAASDNLYLASDLVVGGSISADIINAETRVNAGTGVFAGPLGFVSGFGGLSLGIPSPLTPIAVPGCINTIGSITSMTSVNAPLANFGYANIGIMDAVLMSDIINSSIFNWHQHIGNHGYPTSSPLSNFVGI